MEIDKTPAWTTRTFHDDGFKLVESTSVRDGQIWGFEVSRDESSLFYLHTDNEGSALSWKGKLSVTDFPRAAFNELPTALLGRSLSADFSDSSIKQAMALISTNGKDVVDFDLQDKKQREAFEAGLKSGDDMFVRTDIQLGIDGNDVSYAFTAMTPDKGKSGEVESGELSLRIYSGREYTSKVVDFALKHHAMSNALTPAIDSTKTATLLNKYANIRKK